MNLVFDPWIPCLLRNGRTEKKSLRDCFASADIMDTAVRPHERVALMRLLLCIAYAAVGIPRDYDAWEACRDSLPEQAQSYLEQWKDSFHLFHAEKPFLQLPSIRSASATKGGKKDDEKALTPTSKLDFALAAGNNSTLFDHDALDKNRALAPEHLALSLLTFQMFSPGGLMGQVLWGNVQTDKSSCDAPCAPASMLHTFVRGTSLPETLHKNLLSEEQLSSYSRFGEMNKRDWRGRPLWEHMPEDPDDAAAIANATQTFLGRMVPLARAVHLHPDGRNMLLGNGLTYPSFTNPKNPFPEEVSATIVVGGRKKDERFLLGAQPGKALWRQLHALTVRRHGENTQGQSCPALEHYEDGEVDLVVAALVREQADIVDSIESIFHVPAAMFRQDGHYTYASEVNRAEEIENALAFAMGIYRKLTDGGWTSRLKIAGARKGDILAALHAKATRHYWTSVEQGVPLLLRLTEACGSTAFPVLQQEWCSLLRRSALEAYALACGKDTERRMRAYINGRRTLLHRTASLLPALTKEDA